MARSGTLALLIEFYLPPSVGREGLIETSLSAYRPLLRLLESHRSSAALTLAMDPALASELIRQGQSGVLHAIATLAEAGPLELAAGSRGHALLPRLPRREVDRQLRLGDQALRDCFGWSYRPRGLLPPALAYARVVAEAALARNLRWLALDELSLGRLGKAPTRSVATLPGNDRLALFFRDRALSHSFLSGEGWRSREQIRQLSRGYRVLWIPAECFREEATRERLNELLSGRGPALATVSTLAARFPDRVSVEPLPSSSRTTPTQLARGIPFATWSAPDNEIQAMLWRLAFLGWREAERLEAAAPDAPETARLRMAVDASQHSAPFRHASYGPDWLPSAVLAAGDLLAAAIDAGGALVPSEVREETSALHRHLLDAVAERDARVAQARQER